MSFPLAQTIGHAVYVAGATNSHGNPVDSWAAPVDVAVYGYGPPTRTQESEPGGTQVIQGLQIFAPPGLAVSAQDRFVVDGLTYEVEGEVGDWTHGPFRYAPGIVINVKRVEGGR